MFSPKEFSQQVVDEPESIATSGSRTDENTGSIVACHLSLFGFVDEDGPAPLESEEVPVSLLFE